MLIGIISDTHGLLRPQVLEVLKDVDLIIHAGDIGDATVLEKLEETAPVIAVRGNCDRGEWAKELPGTDVYDTGSQLIYLMHDINQLDLDLEATGINILVYGHSHMPSLERCGSVTYLNPGSAGPQRFTLPVTMALLKIKKSCFNIELIDLKKKKR